jgi:hypothetical protein
MTESIVERFAEQIVEFMEKILNLLRDDQKMDCLDKVSDAIECKKIVLNGKNRG